MCGIFGWITPGRLVDRARGVQATNVMRHRGPDDEGYLFCGLARSEAAQASRDATKGLCQPHWRDAVLLPDADAMLGFRRRAIHDLSEAGHRPMVTPDGKLWIVFNGEVSNLPELRGHLPTRGAYSRLWRRAHRPGHRNMIGRLHRPGGFAGTA